MFSPVPGLGTITKLVRCTFRAGRPPATSQRPTSLNSSARR